MRMSLCLLIFTPFFLTWILKRKDWNIHWMICASSLAASCSIILRGICQKVLWKYFGNWRGRIVNTGFGMQPSIPLGFFQQGFGNRKWIIFITTPAAKGWCFGPKTWDFRLHCSGQRGRKTMCNYRMWVGSEGRRPAVSYFDGDRVPRRARYRNMSPGSAMVVTP